MRHIRIVLLLLTVLFVMGCGAGTSTTTGAGTGTGEGKGSGSGSGSAGKVVADTVPSTHGLIYDPAEQTFFPRVEPGDTIKFKQTVEFPLSSPCDGTFDNKTCHILPNPASGPPFMGVFPYQCTDASYPCPDPEIVVGTDDTGTEGFKPDKKRQEELQKKHKTSKLAKDTGSNLDHVAKKAYLECSNGTQLKAFPSTLNLSIDTPSINFVTSGDKSKAVDWKVAAIDDHQFCAEDDNIHGNANDHSKAVCTVTGKSFGATFTLNGNNCGNTQAKVTVNLQ